jgi:hypothetical protein
MAIDRPLTSISVPASGHLVSQSAGPQKSAPSPNHERASTFQSPRDQSFRLVDAYRIPMLVVDHHESRSPSLPHQITAISALSRLRASSTHASGKLAIEAASVFNRTGPEFSCNRPERDAPRVFDPALESDSATIKRLGGEK